jgi:hypothetical protein
MIDVIVVGAGHAGCEAALSLAHSGKETVLITLNMEHIAKMPCNPSIGGPAKGIVVREIDALGGVMPKVADETALQFKMLNTAKGPGVWSLRVQSDKLAYSQRMREICTHTAHLQIIEDIVDEVLVEQADLRQCQPDSVAVSLQPSGFHLVGVDAQAQGAVVDARQFVVGEYPLADGIGQFLDADAEKLPFADGLDALYLCGGGINRRIGSQLDMVVLHATAQPEKRDDENGGTEKYDAESVGLSHGLVLHL